MPRWKLVSPDPENGMLAFRQPGSVTVNFKRYPFFTCSRFGKDHPRISKLWGLVLGTAAFVLISSSSIVKNPSPGANSVRQSRHDAAVLATARHKRRRLRNLSPRFSPCVRDSIRNR